MTGIRFDKGHFVLAFSLAAYSWALFVGRPADLFCANGEYFVRGESKLAAGLEPRNSLEIVRKCLRLGKLCRLCSAMRQSQRGDFFGIIQKFFGLLAQFACKDREFEYDRGCAGFIRDEFHAFGFIHPIVRQRFRRSRVPECLRVPMRALLN